MIAYIFASGVINHRHLLHLKLNPGDMIIAADGGARHCIALELTPDFVIGDFDSLNNQEIESLKTSGVHFIKHPRRKDFTDLELAIRFACQKNMVEIHIYGALGLRWDQTLANLMLLASPELDCTSVRIVDDNQTIFLLQGETSREIHGQPGDTVSLIPIGGDVHGIVTHGLEYPLANETLVFGKTRGVSNVLLTSPATITQQDGYMVCVVLHK